MANSLSYESLAEFAEFVRREAHLLARFPDLLFQQASNWPDDSMPCNAARNRRPGTTRRPWLRWRNKPAHPDPCRLTILARPGVGFEVAPGTGALLYAEGSVARVMDLSRARPEVLLDAHDGEVTACAYSSDGGEVVTACRDGRLRFWDASTGALRHAAPAFRDVTVCAYSPDAAVVVVGLESGHLAFFEPRGGMVEIEPHAHPARISLCAWSPEGSRLVTASVDGTLQLRAGLGSPPIARHAMQASSCAFPPEAGRFVTGDEVDPLIRVWDASTGALLDERVVRQRAPNSPHTPGGEGGVACCAFSPGGERLALGCWDCSIRIWDARGMVEDEALTGHGEPVVACAFLPGGRAVVSRDRSGTIKLFDLRSEKDPRRAELHTGFVERFVVSRDGRGLASESWDGTWKVWDVDAARCLTTARAPSGAPPAELGSWTEPAGAGRHAGGLRVRCEVASPDAARTALLAPAGRSLELRDGRSGIRVALLEERSPDAPLRGLMSLLGVTACAFSSDGKYLAASSDDKTIKVWSAEDGSLRARFPTDGVGTVVAGTGPRDFVCGDATGGVYFLRIEDEGSPPYSAGKTSSARR